MSELSMPSQDQESFHLLQISESQSDSLPDLDLVTVNTQHKKKKVRLKRRDRNTSRSSVHVGGHKSGDDEAGGWPTGLLLPSLSNGLCPSALCVMTSVSFTSVIFLLGLSYITTQLSSRVTDLEYELRMKISDDELNSVPQKIKLLDNNLKSLVSNQSGIVDSIVKLNNILISFHDKIDKISKDKGNIKIKNLEIKLNSIKKEVEILTELSKGNEDEINNITNILATLNITSPYNIDSTPKTSQEYEPFHVGRP